MYAPAKEVLEQLIDKHGVVGVLGMMSDICHAKAEHIESNWQDASLARVWTRLANKIDPSDAIQTLSKMTGHK